MLTYLSQVKLFVWMSVCLCKYFMNDICLWVGLCLCECKKLLQTRKAGRWLEYKLYTVIVLN